MTVKSDRSLTEAERGRLAAHLRDRASLTVPVDPGYSIASAVCDRWEGGTARNAMLDLTGPEPRWLTFAHFGDRSRRLASGLRELGVGSGDRVAVVLAQGPEAATAHLAIYRLAAVAVPLSVMHGTDAITHRIADSGAKVAIVDAATWEKVADHADLRGLCHWIVDSDAVRAEAGIVALESLIAGGQPVTPQPGIGPETPALIVYTSGTTGQPKGALHGHRVVAAHAAPIAMVHDGFPQPDDLLWSPADWAWAGGLIDCLLSAWHAGVPIVAYRGRRFDPDEILDMMARWRVRNTFLPPTALRMLRAALASPRADMPRLRSLMTGGEAASADLLEWSAEVLGTLPNEVYGQTEASMVLGNSGAAHPVKAGSPGFALPNSVVEVLDGDGRPALAGQEGELAVRADSSPVFLGYWERPDATAAKVADGWLRTGDVGVRDEDGYFWFVARADDVIISAGYRIGPGEIESCIGTHPAVAAVAVVGVPDDSRGEAVKAFVELAADAPEHDALAEELKAMVRARLAPYEVPREVEFVDQLPRTVTGKVQRSVLRATGPREKGSA